MYLGFALVLVGAWLLLDAWSPLLAVLAFVLAADRWYIAYEEQRLVIKFGQAYGAYKQRVRRWV